MDGAVEKAIKRYCKFMKCQFIGYSFGLYEFSDGTLLTQRDLISITRDF